MNSIVLDVALIIIGFILGVLFSFVFLIAERETHIEIHKNYALCYELTKPKTATSSHASKFSGRHKLINGELYCYDDRGSIYPWGGG